MRVPSVEAGAAEAFDAGAVGLVVAGFEDEGNAEVGGDALDGVGHGADVGFGLDDAGAGDEEEPARADLHRADFKRVAHEGDSTGGSVGQVSGRLSVRRSASTLDRGWKPDGEVHACASGPRSPERRDGEHAVRVPMSEARVTRRGCATTPTVLGRSCAEVWEREARFAA